MKTEPEVPLVGLSNLREEVISTADGGAFVDPSSCVGQSLHSMALGQPSRRLGGEGDWHTSETSKSFFNHRVNQKPEAQRRVAGMES